MQPLRESSFDHDLLADLETDLRAVVTAAVDAIEGADHAAVGLVGSDGPMVATSGVAGMLEAAQRKVGEGPTLDAGRSGVITRINYLSDDQWPTFEQVCSEYKIRSVAAFPLVDDGTTVGVLTFYSSDHHAFGAPELRIGRSAAAGLSRLLRDR